MDSNLPKNALTANAQNKSKLLFVTGIILIVASALSILATLLIVFFSAIAIIVGDVNLGVDFSAVMIGISLAFGAVLAPVSLYAAIRGIMQSNLIKCRKLGVVMIILNSVTLVADLLSTISFNDDIEMIIAQIIYRAAFSFTLPVLYLIGTNIAIKRQEPDRKYKDIIKSI
ncbi:MULTISPECIES: hypothetical protein [unclassified Ruminococcus]|uniref:hypothetical protein n=1 Tax=unclassified Ruminococcus TaxID=2608920 RepID=UPI00210A9BDA|nr:MULTISPECIES: hypothetical protein [unclassified Ruminococcus]MCQ4022012.1 hypothetical protein [Ruminococcus sp. zg-924]MCQ4114548.1 hypothetical protein [Ruminococcus sp. zg-921]